MLSPSTAALAVSVARGVIKFGHRLDTLMAEQQAVQGGLALVMPKVYAGPSATQKKRELRLYLAEWEKSGGPDVLGADREELARELGKAVSNDTFLGECYARVYPDRLTVAPLNPDGEYVVELRKLFPRFDLSDPDCLAAAFHVAAGRDDRQIGYGARVGLLVADVLAEFGTQNTALFVRDAGMQTVVQAVLERFSRPELDAFHQWSPLLRHALNATLNGLLDARHALVTDSQWLATLLDVLVEARNDPASGEDFVAGLFQGRGYPLLISHGLGRAAEVLSEDQTNTFKQLAADFLKSAAPLVRDSPRFGRIFAEHWGDLLRAGLAALERHGPAVLQTQPTLLRDVLTRMTRELSQIPNADLLSHQTIFRLGDAAIAAVAANPELLDAQVQGQPWLKVLLKSFVSTVARDGIRLSFSREGLEEIVSDAAGVLAQHPELIVAAENADLPRQVVGGILRAVSELPSLDARTIATTAATGTLRALAENPGLVKTEYAGLIAEFAGRLAELVRTRALTGLTASAIAGATVGTLLHNPALFDDAKCNLATAALDATVQVADKDPARLLTGKTLANTVREVLAAIARCGRTRLVSAPSDDAVKLLAEVIQNSLTQVRGELGRRVDLPGVPLVIGGLVAAWARGDFVKIDPEAPDFLDLFGRVVTGAVAQ